jgi:uncharacterized protein DUF4340
MSNRRTAILGAAFSVLVLYFALFEGFSVERPAPEWEQGEKILRCDRGVPTEMQVSGARGRVSGKRENERWVSDPPGPYASEAFADLADALCRLPIIDRIEPTSPTSGPLDLAQFGLEPPVAELDVVGGGGRHILLVGEATPANNLMYVKLQDRPEVWKVGVELRSDVEKVIVQAKGEGAES